MALHLDAPPGEVDDRGRGLHAPAFRCHSSTYSKTEVYSGYYPDLSGPGGFNHFSYRVYFFTYPVFRTFTAMVEIGF